MKGLEWKGCGLGERLVLLAATGFGLGLIPVAPATFATLLGVVIVAGLPDCGLLWQIGVAAVLALSAFPLCTAADRHFGGKDDRRIVADEYLTFPICVIGLPWRAHPWLLVAAYLSHRFFDIVKPFPAYQVQRLKGGVGIATDDVISSLYALAFCHLARVAAEWLQR